ncbi:MAG: hypothetical protein LBR17_04440 [Bacteroidales bacterium]|jgi:hypothetical protein|nr:hypothetical protein [Bacteroidales bacterium]
MESNYKKLESNSGVLESNYRTLEFDSGNALLDKGYTKHYFEEGRRICSAIGGNVSEWVLRFCVLIVKANTRLSKVIASLVNTSLLAVILH